MPALSPPSKDSAGSTPDENFSTVAVPTTIRLGRWQVTMSFWSLLSAMVWLFYGALAASLYGTRDAIIAIVLATIAFAVINAAMTRLGIRHGLNSTLLTKTIFGRWGAFLTALLLAATVLYYAVFESSTLAVAFQAYFDAGDIRIWYAVVVLAMLPLMLGSVQSWMGKLNGVLLPFYFIGLIAAVIAAHIKFGSDSSWLDYSGIVPAEGRSLPGWVLSAILYMGIFVNMPTTVDFARFARKEDERFHEVVTFGGVFYLVLFLINGLAGIYLVQTVLPDQEASEIGVVLAILASLGFAGLLFIVVSQTRVNSLNYYVSTTNFERILSGFTSIRLHRAVWVSGVATLVFLLMLTDVFSYLQAALTWQGLLAVGWVGVVLTHFVLDATDRTEGPVYDDTQLPRIGRGLIAWIVPALVGIFLLENDIVPPVLAQSAQLISLALSIVLYTVIYLTFGPRRTAPITDSDGTELAVPSQSSH